jgi:hypothetical protein
VATVPPVPMLCEKHLRNCRLLENREVLLHCLPKGGTVAEVGVLAGDYSAKILEVVQPEKFLLLDLFEADDWGWSRRFTAKDHQAFVEARFAKEISAGLIETRRGDASVELAKFNDGCFDWVYIDTDHTYESMKRELDIAGKKVKPDGLIVVNDYTLYDHVQEVAYGVMHATNEFCLEQDWELVYLAFQQHGFNDVVLRRITA